MARGRAGVGERIERIAEKILRNQGYAIHRVVRTSRRVGAFWINNRNDIFGADILAKKNGERMRYIQVTKDTHIGGRKAKLVAIPWDPGLESVELWRWVGGEGKHSHSTTGKARERMYFQVYRLDRGFELDKSDRIRLNSE